MSTICYVYYLLSGSVSWCMFAGFESVGTGAIHLYNSNLFNNEVAAVEIKMLQNVVPFQDNKTCVIRDTKIISHFTGECYDYFISQAMGYILLISPLGP